MNATGFLDIDPIKEKMKNNVMRQMLISAFQYKDDVLKKDIDLQGADWDEVSQITHLSFYSILQEFPKLENEYNRQAQEDKLKSIDQSNNFASQISGTPDLFKNKRSLQTGPKEIQESERSLINTSHVPKPSNKNQFFNTHNSAKDLGSHSNILKSISNIQGNSEEELKNKQDNTNVNNKNPFYKIKKIFNTLKFVDRTKKIEILKTRESENKDDHISQASEDIEKMIEDPFKNVGVNKIKQELRGRLYLMIKNNIHDNQDNFFCRPEVVRSLKMLCDVCGDKLDQKICLREFADGYLGKTLGYKLMRFFSKTPFFGQKFINFITEKVFFNYQFINCLIKCANNIAESLDYMATNMDYKDQLDEIREEMTIDIMELVKVQESLHIQFSNLVGFIRTKIAAFRIIEYQKKLLIENEQQGLISERDRQLLSKKFNNRLLCINKIQPESLYIDINKATVFQMSYPMFSNLSELQMERIVDQRTKEEFKKEGKFLNKQLNQKYLYLKLALIYQQEDRCQFLYLVNDGIVKETFSATRFYRKTKSGVSNIANICAYDGKNVTTLNSITDCKLYKIKKCKI